MSIVTLTYDDIMANAYLRSRDEVVLHELEQVFEEAQTTTREFLEEVGVLGENPTFTHIATVSRLQGEFASDVVSMEAIKTTALSGLKASWLIIKDAFAAAVKLQTANKAKLRQLKRQASQLQSQLAEATEEGQDEFKFSRHSYLLLTDKRGGKVLSPQAQGFLVAKLPKAIQALTARAFDNAKKDLTEVTAQELREDFFNFALKTLKASGATIEEKTFNEEEGLVAIYTWSSGLRCVITMLKGNNGWMKVTVADQKADRSITPAPIKVKQAKAFAKELDSLLSVAEAQLEQVSALKSLIGFGDKMVAHGEGHEAAVHAAKEAIKICVTLSNYFPTQALWLAGHYEAYLAACGKTYSKA